MNSRRKFIATVATVTMVVTGLALPAWADERQDLVNQQQENENRMKEIKSSLEGIDVNLQDAFLELEKLVRKSLEQKLIWRMHNKNWQLQNVRRKLTQLFVCRPKRTRRYLW